MTDPLPTLHTRWSMLDQLHGADREQAWRWFQTTYDAFVRDCLGRHLRGERLTRATEAFWGYLFASNVLTNADRGRRFRSLLFGTLRNYVRRFQREDHYAQQPDADDDLTTREPAHEDPAVEAADMRAFAAATLDRALADVEAKAPRQASVLRQFYGIGAPARPVRDIAAELGIQENALHQLLWRARRSLRDTWIEILGHTVGTQQDLDDELRLMLAVLGHERPGLLDR